MIMWIATMLNARVQNKVCKCMAAYKHLLMLPGHSFMLASFSSRIATSFSSRSHCKALT